MPFEKNENLDKIIADFNESDPRDRIRFFLNLLQYTIPKYQSLRLEKESEKIKPLRIIVETKEQKNRLKNF